MANKEKTEKIKQNDRDVEEWWLCLMYMAYQNSFATGRRLAAKLYFCTAFKPGTKIKELKRRSPKNHFVRNKSL